MGIDIETARFIMRETKQFILNKEILTIGRQNLQLGHHEFCNLLNEYNIQSSNNLDCSIYHTENRFADCLFQYLGASKIESIDVSDYEGAQFIHDLNIPIPDEWKHSFDLVCECGSLEHVFNFPSAITNCLEMVRLGGGFLWVTPSNNFCGHGFYQFSPELLYRVLCPENGFEVKKMIAVEYGPLRNWYNVIDPATKRDRVKLINNYPVQLIVLAQRISNVKPFNKIPQQSDYSAIWKNHSTNATEITIIKKSIKRKFKDFLIEKSPRIARIIQSLQNSSWNIDFSFRNTSSFVKEDKNTFSSKN